MGEPRSYSNSVQSQYDWSNVNPSIAVIDAISSMMNVDPTTLSKETGTTLFDHVDPEALDTLVTDDEPVSISFTVDEYRIRIEGSELVVFYE